MNHISESVVDFIGVYPNALDRLVCEQVIDTTDKLLAREGIDRSGQFPNKLQGGADTSATIGATQIVAREHGMSPGIAELDQVVHQCTVQYLENFPVYQETLKSYHIKLQRTLPGEGYHVWHSESSSTIFKTRDLVWAVFLNDVLDGGETEFLYQHRRVVPEQGTVVIWPASFTHTHRGNPPLSGVKYIATGWWSSCESE